MSEYEYQQVMKLLDEVYNIWGRGLDRDEWESIGWVAYMEARKKHISEYYSDYWEEIARNVVASINRMRDVRNEKISLESRLSLNCKLGESKEEIGSILFPTQGDFTNGIALWDYVKHLGKKKFIIMKSLAWREDDYEIMEKMHMSKDEYYSIKFELQEDMMHYINIYSGGKEI